MHLTVQGHQVDVGDALRSHVETQLSGIVEKYFDNAHDATVTFSHDAYRYKVDIHVHVGRDMFLKSTADEPDPYPAFEAALAKVDKRLRRHKRRLRDHHLKSSQAEMAAQASAFVLSGDDIDGSPNDAEDEGEPAVIAEMKTPIETLSVAEAVMRMDLSDLPALMFKNRSHGGLNMIYRRSDGHIGWVDPDGNQTA